MGCNHPATCVAVDFSPMAVLARGSWLAAAYLGAETAFTARNLRIRRRPENHRLMLGNPKETP